MATVNAFFLVAAILLVSFDLLDAVSKKKEVQEFRIIIYARNSTFSTNVSCVNYA